MRQLTRWLGACATLLASTYCSAHPQKATATYMGNEAVMVAAGPKKIIFDPLFNYDYGHYQRVPDNMVQAMIKGEKPFDNIAAVFVSHAHADHFNAGDMLRFLKAQGKTRLFAHKQAAEELKALPGSDSVMKQVTAINLEYGAKPWTHKIDGVTIEAVYIPHSGWPNHHAKVANLVFRVTLAGKTTVIHMGDADPNDKHFKPLDAHWQKRLTHTAFPPFWFFGSAPGRQILDKRINAKKSVGVHVPVKVPAPLKNSGLDYFSKPGEQRVID